MCSFFHEVLIKFRSRKGINKGKTHQLAFYMPSSAFVSGILSCKMNICEFCNDLQATPSVFLLQIQVNCRVWFSRWFSQWFEYIRFRLLDQIKIRSAIIVNPQVASPVARGPNVKFHIGIAASITRSMSRLRPLYLSG